MTRAVSLAPVDSLPNESEWGWQLRHAVTSVEGLRRVLNLSAGELEGALRAERAGLPLRITPYYLSLCDPNDPECPVRKQCVPDLREGDVVKGDLDDPLGEVSHEVAPHLVRRYPDRALLLATDHCGVYCRFCTRSRMVGAGSGAIPLSDLGPAFDYLASHPEVKDVILSGGDPLTLSTKRLVSIVESLRQISSVETIRLATRVPVTLPMRVTGELVEALRPFHPLWLMTHFNHPKELTEQAALACARLSDGGFPVMNQTVLLAGVNDSAAVLKSLFRRLVRARVRPYYLLQADPVRGSSHLRTPLNLGLSIMDELQGNLSGIALPKFICDTPGGKGKVHLSPPAVLAERPGVTTLRTFRGESVDYIDPPV